ncbi:hypothetical protein S40293_06052 [Stachybotrys chartarum IBT 40293]|nr:hypothetical protein S40293_06052 [Stachybotrys chartarum IBT 40293]
MADANKKRKRQNQEAGSKPKKKVVIDAPNTAPSTAKVASVLRPKHCPPVIAVTPGVQLPDNLTFHSYMRQDDVKSKKDIFDKELAIQSTSHHSIDYTGKEEAPRGLLNHYLGIYDPQTGKLQVVEAKKMVIRPSVRARQATAAQMGEREAKQTMMEARTELGQTFGTKKAKKAIQERVLNAISPMKKPGETPVAQLDDASRAMLRSVGEITSTMATREELQAAADEARPGPVPNLEAEEIQDVYDPEAIIGASILNLVPVRDWQEAVSRKEGIQVVSKYVATRFNQVAANDADVTRLRVLRYMYFVILFYLSSRPSKQRGVRQLPPREQLREKLAPAPEAVIENIRRRFSEAGQVRKAHIESIMAYCCVFACIIDNFQVDPQDLQGDLRLEPKEMDLYFHVIGARVKKVKNKDKGVTHWARLTLPLEFPKQRHMAQRRK